METKSIPGSISGNSGMVHLAEINQTPSLYSMLQYWQSSDTDAWGKKLSQILANNLDHGGRGIGLRICVRYCRSKLCCHFFQLSFVWGKWDELVLTTLALLYERDQEVIKNILMFFFNKKNSHVEQMVLFRPKRMSKPVSLHLKGFIFRLR